MSFAVERVSTMGAALGSADDTGALASGGSESSLGDVAGTAKLRSDCVVAANPVAIPVACTIFPKEIFRASRRWAARKYPNLVHWGESARGGHFAAFEQPEIFVDEIRASFRTVR